MLMCTTEVAIYSYVCPEYMQKQRDFGPWSQRQA